MQSIIIVCLSELYFNSVNEFGLFVCVMETSPLTSDLVYRHTVRNVIAVKGLFILTHRYFSQFVDLAIIFPEI